MTQDTEWGLPALGLNRRHFGYTSLPYVPELFIHQAGATLKRDNDLPAG